MIPRHEDAALIGLVLLWTVILFAVFTFFAGA